MMKVPYALQESKLHGLGVFAVEDVEADSLVWELHPVLDLVLKRETWDLLLQNSVVSEYLNSWLCSHGDDMRLLATDGSQFMNHSDTPNLRDDGDQMFAARRIHKGEEFTFQYHDDDLHFLKTGK